MSPRRVHVRIDELVLDGTAGDARAIRGAVQHELARLLRERGAPERSRTVGVARTEARAGRHVGVDVAHALHRELGA